MTFSTDRRLATEFLGTMILVATVVGSGIMAETLTSDVALALLGNTIPTGAILVVLITMFGPISGAHFNPAVSMVFALRGDLPVALFGAYVAAQCLGGVSGSLLAHAMFEQDILQISEKIRTGQAQWLAEVVATFGLVAVILGGIRFRGDAVPWMVGLYITAAYWFTASTSFANPAVALGRTFTNTFSGIRPADLPAFVVAQLVGAAIGLAVMGWLLATPKTKGQRAERA